MNLQVEGYHGSARLVIYCVDAAGNIHPYSLFGENCKDGIYQRVLNFTSDCSIRYAFNSNAEQYLYRSVASRTSYISLKK